MSLAAATSGGGDMGDEGWRRAWEQAARQHGVISRDQALRAGLSRRQIDHHQKRQRWARLHPGVYRVEGASPGWRADLTAACLWAGPTALVSHRAAAALWRLEGYDEGEVELLVTGKVRSRPGVTVHRTRCLDHRDTNRLEGFTVTGLARTLLDLAAVDELARVRRALHGALRNKAITVERLGQALARNAGRPGMRVMAELLAEVTGQGGPTESELEDLVQDVLRSGGFPAPVRQKVVQVKGRRRRLDFLIPGTRVVIEADGYATHSPVDVFEDDRRRNNALVARGYLVLHWTWTALTEDPVALLEELHQVLGFQRRAA